MDMNTVETPVIKMRINNLHKQVDPYNEKKGKSFLNSFSVVEKLKSLVAGTKLYIIIPILILVVLVVWKPDFIKYEVVDDEGNTMNKLSYKKLFTYWSAVSILLCIGIFGLKYNMKK